MKMKVKMLSYHHTNQNLVRPSLLNSCLLLQFYNELLKPNEYFNLSYCNSITIYLTDKWRDPARIRSVWFVFYYYFCVQNNSFWTLALTKVLNKPTLTIRQIKTESRRLLHTRCGKHVASRRTYMVHMLILQTFRWPESTDSTPETLFWTIGSFSCCVSGDTWRITPTDVTMISQFKDFLLYSSSLVETDHADFSNKSCVYF